MHKLIVFALLLTGPQSADKKDQPLVSATNPVYLSCTVWTGKEWTKPAVRSVRTSVKQSTKGYRAYGQVSVSVNGGYCENTTTLFVAAPNSNEFKPVYATSEGGNGISLVGWSASGDRLLAEVTFWTYDSDIGFGFIPLIYDASRNSAKELRDMDKALVRLLGPDCSFEDHVRGWKTDDQLLVRISPGPSTEEEEDHSCVAQPRFFVYDIQRDTLQPAQPKPKPKSK